ncbi:putative T7SS-secreted protein [Streptomyces antarcticus]|uniref:putative T7SS-secreted protein n=1 Tax=Streptomyces antarcticus TaxID=2996458 RepID=UPI0022B04032|nr:RHS repeat-associated core domain-containing protein [Streptomyces sp. H34-S5]MCZ4083353.1 DUF6531 domain-containing protein [Streptomyces sp. H34-S5]
MVSWDDLGRLTDKGIDLVDKGIDKGKELVGEGIDKSTDALGAGLEKVGAEGWADSVEDWGDGTASSLGAEVGEQQLGQTEEPNELVHGNPGKVRESITNLRDFQRAFDLVGAGMKKLDSASWKGEAANSFRENFQTLPTDWLHAADAFENAAQALETYASAVTTAQGKAREAIDLYKEAQQDYKVAADAHNKKVDAYNDARNSDNPLPRPADVTDPSQDKRQRAQEILKAARSARKEAADTAKAAVTAAMAHAPKEPTGREKAKLELADYAFGQGVEMMHFGGGIVKGAAGLVNFVRSVNALDPYNITHPAEYYKNMNMTLAGLVSTAANPDRALKNAWDAAKGDPSEFLGRLVPELIGTKGAGVLRTGLRAGLKPTAGSTLRRNVNGAPMTNSQIPSSVCKGPTDPVNLATGAMYLPQVDVVLSGALPLVVSRRAQSTFTAGQWFGPRWASTLDQRLEIDPQGVILVSEDGLLLDYPHPAPGEATLPAHGPRWPLDRDAEGGGYTLTDPEDGTVRRFVPHGTDRALLTRVEDRNGRWIAFEYNTAGAPTAIVHHGGYRLRVSTSRGRVTELHWVAGGESEDVRLIRYGYDDGGHLTEIFNSSDEPLLFGVDPSGLILSWRDRNGYSYAYRYDTSGRCIGEGGTEGHLKALIEYGATDPVSGLRMTSVTDALGHTSHYVFDRHHRLVSQTDPLGAATRNEHDERGRLKEWTDALGYSTRFTFDPADNIIAVTRPDGQGSTATYTSTGRPLTVVGPSGETWRYAYDEAGNCVSATDPTGATTRYIYDERGNLRCVVDPAGNRTLLDCDAAGLTTRLTEPTGAVTSLQRDAFGRVTSETDPLGRTTHYVWNVEGRILQRRGPDGSTETWSYDAEGNCLLHTDASGATHTYEYGHFDQLAARTGPDGSRFTFTYDAALRLTSVTNDQGLTWDYGYDAAGQLVSECDFDGRTVDYAYDPTGKLVARTTPAGHTVRYQRDVLGRPLVKDADGAISRYFYDRSGRLVRAVNEDADLVITRDELGRTTSETVGEAVLHYGYDAAGRRTTRTTPSGVLQELTLDPAGRLIQLASGDHHLSFRYDDAGQEVQRHCGQIEMRTEWNAAGRPQAHVIRANGTDHRRDYAYRADGHLTSVRDSSTGVRTLTLDAAARVTTVHAADWSERYAYDRAGNIATADWPLRHASAEATGERTYSGTLLHHAGGVRYEYDAQGRVILRQKTRLSRKPDTWRYDWDAEDRLRSVTTPDGTTWCYLYDALGRRIAKQRLGDDGRSVAEEVTFTWDGSVLCEQTTRSSHLPHPVTITWDHDGLVPVAQLERILDGPSGQREIDRRFFAIVTDLIGTPTALLDEQGETAWRARSTLWGLTGWSTDSSAYTPLRFPGQYSDPESGLHYNVHRYYDPETARYMSQDPLGLAAAPHPASYVSNPLSWSDPLGLIPCEEAAKIAAAKKESVLGTGVPTRQGASVGYTDSFSYKKTFFAEHPELKGKVVVHHAIEQQTLNRYPGLFKPEEIHSIENLRGIPKGDINSRIHLSEIRVEWNRFYESHPNPTRQEVLDHATKIDDKLGNWFSPRIR